MQQVDGSCGVVHLALAHIIKLVHDCLHAGDEPSEA